LSTIARDIDCAAVNVTVLTIDSATKLPPEADGAVVVTGSHGAIYAAYLSAKADVRAAIHHDAGIGLDEAGIGGLAYAERLGLAMAAIATERAHRRPPPPQAEGRTEVDGILCLDSASMLGADDRDRVAATGSHGALIAGTTTAPMRLRLIMFNDAGPCIERAGIQGLDVLGQAGIAAIAVAARIGDGSPLCRTE
jgi:hypothetical protein